MGVNIKLLPFNNVANTGLATLDLNNLLGYTIERMTFQLGGTAFTKANITSFQIKANGKVIYDSSGARIDARMQYRGIAANANFLTIDFSEIHARTELGQNIGSIDTTAGIQNLKLEMQISGATAPTIQGYAECSRPQIDNAQAPTRNLLARVHNSTVTIGAGGTFSIPVPHFFPADGGSLFKRIHIFSANMTGVAIKKNGIVVEETIKAVNDFRQTEYKKTPQAGLYVVDFVQDDNQSSILNTRDAQTMEINGTFSAGETITIEIEVLEPLGAY